MGFLKSKSGSIISEYFKLLDDMGNLKSGDMCDLALYGDRLELKTPFNKQTVSLSYGQISDVFHGRKTEVVESKKSPIGRALVGGVLFGGAGAVVGAVSGAGNKEKKSTKLYLIISYRSSDGEDRILKFEDTRKYKGKKIAIKLRELCSLDPQDLAQSTRLSL